MKNMKIPRITKLTELFGWQTPAADPKNYDEQGQPIRPKQRDRGDAR